MKSKYQIENLSWYLEGLFVKRIVKFQQKNG